MTDRKNNPVSRTALENLCALERMSAFLTHYPRLITAQDVQEIASVGVDAREAVLLLLCAACGLDAQERPQDRYLIERYFRPSLDRLDIKMFAENPYLHLIRFPSGKSGRWEMTVMTYAPYELFVRDEMLVMPDGREIPRLGYFEEPFSYPAVLEDGREWMTVTPNEIATMQPALDAAYGSVCALGLGLGYFALMASQKETVRSVTVVERDEDVIRLFERHILPQFPCGEKVRIVRADAFDYVKGTLARSDADFVFADLWHDTLDGAPMYVRLKRLEKQAPGKKFVYWIEASILAFLRSLAIEEWTQGKIEAFRGIIDAQMDAQALRSALSDERLREKVGVLDDALLCP